MSREKVLLVDDEPHVTEALMRNLRAEPWELFTASTGREALEACKRHDFTVVVSDEQMPGMSGSSLLAEIHREYPRTVRIILTGQASVEAAIRAINEGEVYRFLTKPCKPADFKLILNQAIQQKRMVDQTRALLSKLQNQVRRMSVGNDDIERIDRDQDGAIMIADVETDLDEILQDMQRELAVC